MRLLRRAYPVLTDMAHHTFNSKFANYYDAFGCHGLWQDDRTKYD